MARRLTLLCACAALGAPLAQAGDSWGGLGESLSGMMDKVNDASEKIKDNGKKAYGWAKIKACAYKVSKEIEAANQTMTDQLKSDCESAASKVSFVHDHTLALCLSLGTGKIESTLEQQGEKLEKSCLEAVDDAPGNMKSAISDWAAEGKNTIDTSLGTSVEDAMSKAKEKFGDAERKFASTAPFFHDVAIRAGTIAAAGAAAMAVVGAAAATAFRLRHTHLAMEASPILEEAGAMQADPELTA